MAALTVASSDCNNRISQNLVLEENGMNLRDASFSSYLGRGEDSFMTKLRDLIPIQTSDLIATTESPHPLPFGRKHQHHQNGEISIFNAEKYFNGGKEDERTGSSKRGRRGEMQRGGRIEQRRSKALLQRTTTGLCSEVNGNSQTALLQRLQKDPPANLQKQGAGRRIFGSLSCSPCSRKKAVSINEQAVEKRNTGRLEEPSHARNCSNQPQFVRREEAGLGIKKEEIFNFPASNQMLGKVTVRKQFEGEVFGSRLLSKERSHAPLRSLMMLTGDGGSKMNEEIAESSVGQSRRVEEEEDDIGSDSSSDLFEIESLASKAYPISSRRPSADFSTTASTERSFATASPANFLCKSSMMKTSMVKEAQQRRRENFLLGCKDSSSVDVAEAADAYNNRQHSHMPNTLFIHG